MIRFGSLKGARADGDKLFGAIDVVDSQEGECPVIGVGPAGADFIEGIGEFRLEQPINHVIGRCIKVTCNDGGNAGIRGFLFEHAESVRELGLTEVTVVTVLMPALAVK